MLTKHWGGNRSDNCPAPGCSEQESLEHILVVCPYYADIRKRLVDLWRCKSDPSITELISETLVGPHQVLVQFILDASVHPKVITLSQKHGTGILQRIFHLTRTWCFSIHRQRVKLLTNNLIF